MTAPTTKAVFISYASQDAEAARRIAEALRAGGVEVWFDQQELRGGDAWDQKIRRQIRDCTLFLPVISAHTQSRPEGYFRREWKVAVARTHDMAEGMPFLLPLTLDGVKDAEALVPDEFRAVQWTAVGPEGLKPAFVEHVRSLLESGGRVLAASPAAPALGRASATKPSTGLPAWARGAIAVAGVGVGLFFAVQNLVFRRPSSRSPTPEKKTDTAPAASAPSAATTAPASSLDFRRLAVSRLENLTGDPSFDPVPRLVESDLMRALNAVTQIRALPVEVSGRKAALAAAREAGAASVIVGTLVRNGAQLELSAEIVLTERGEPFGAVGPIAVPADAVRGPGLAEFAERLTTGANNVMATLQNPPVRLSAAIYSRPWPRWPVAQRETAARLAAATDPTETIEKLRAIVAEAPEFLRAKQDLARILSDNGRFDEAQKIYRELLEQQRGQLSEMEVYAVNYDDALLNGDPERALQAARGLLELRPFSDAVTQAISCLWGQNRPRAAYEELDRWWKVHGAKLPEANRFSVEGGLYATKALMFLREDNPTAALAVVDELEKFLAGRPFPTAGWLKFQALAALGREAEMQQVISDVVALPGSQRVEPVTFAWYAYCQALHAGRKEAAGRWLEAAQRAWEDAPHSGPGYDNMLPLALSLFEATGRYEEALKVADAMERKIPGFPSVVGARALILIAAGRTAEAQPFIRQLETWDERNSRGIPDYWRARLAAHAGDKARAVELLRRAIGRGLWFGDFRSSALEYGRLEPEFAILRGYAPFEQLLKPKG